METIIELENEEYKEKVKQNLIKFGKIFGIVVFIVVLILLIIYFVKSWRKRQR